nr:MAG TPA: hypothetical protein [Caudoviricetes sp.]DAR08178.1 MAG TPA: hypothetical protein [Caudoviricetes sp.]
MHEERHKTKRLHEFNFGLILWPSGLRLRAVDLNEVYKWLT